MEDAVILARLLAGSLPRPEALARYAAARQPRCDLVMEQSHAAIDRYQGPEPERYGAATHQTEEAPGLFAYDAECTTI